MSENLSSKNLFHFTEENVVKSILQRGFYALYREEFVLSMVFNKHMKAQYIPMVCFCNIPLTMVKNHCEIYGSYGIGLNREWAIKNKINPVWYSYANSALMNKFNDSQKEYEQLVKAGIDPKAERAIINNFIQPLLYIKPLYGKSKKNTDTSFYDEKEWRFVPRLKHFNNTFIAHKTVQQGKLDFRYSKNPRNKIPIKSIGELNQNILQNKVQFIARYKLRFKKEDIKYIILKEKSEVPGMIDFINTMIKKGVNPIKEEEEAKALSSKILTLEQIHEDF